jgi:elongation factor G
MNKINTPNIRNVAVVAHGGAGKTSLIQSMLVQAHEITPVTDAAPVMRVEPEEMSHNIAITPHVGHFTWEETTVNLIDTPGYFNFMESTKGVLPGADAAVLVISAVEGVKPETERLWAMLHETKIPTIAFINQIDSEQADFMHALNSIREELHLSASPLTIPIRTAKSELGIVDLIKFEAWTNPINSKDGLPESCDIPKDMQGEVKTLRTQLIEKIVEDDEKLLERYLNGEEISVAELEQALKEAILNHEFVPVLCGAAITSSGVRTLIEAIVSYLPSPIDRDKQRPFRGNAVDDEAQEKGRHCDPDAPFSAIVLKTTVDPFSGKLSVIRVVSGVIKSNQQILNSTQNTKQKTGHVYLLQGKELQQIDSLSAGQIGAIARLSETHTGDTLCDSDNPIVFEPVKYAEAPVVFAVEAEDRKSEEKVAEGLMRLVEEDPTLHVYRDEQTHEMLLSGMGQAHIDIALERLTRKYGSRAKLRAPRVPYRETIRRAVKVQGKLKKQTGGHGQFANCWLQVTPLPLNSGFEFLDEITGGVIPRQYIPSVKKGVQEAMLRGPLGGYPITDIRVALVDGSFHQVDSSDYAFQVAGSLALKTAMSEGETQLLEPIMSLDVIVPAAYTGDVLKDISSRRGKIMNMIAHGSSQEVEAEVPMSELLEYGNILGSITSGQGVYTMSVAHYRDVPPHVQGKLAESFSAQQVAQA